MKHSESRYNALKKYAGWLDRELTSNGITQAKTAGQILLSQRYFFDMAYSSSLIRVIDTLQNVLDEMSLNDIPISRSWRLNERHFGALDDLTNGKETLRLCLEDFRFCPPVSNGRQLLYLGEFPPAGMIPKSESLHAATVRCMTF
jgi:2,3-bisphosphoglycerate-dependent phosphoglycerate mutase